MFYIVADIIGWIAFTIGLAIMISIFTIILGGICRSYYEVFKIGWDFTGKIWWGTAKRR